MQQDVQVVKADEYRVGVPSFQAELVSSVVNRFKMEILPLSFSKDRWSFAWRSPGQSLILSPNLFIEFNIDVTIPGRWDQCSALGPIYGRALTRSTAVAGTDTYNVGYRPKICFGEGDAVDHLAATEERGQGSQQLPAAP